jgi:hypothetical protein
MDKRAIGELQKTVKVAYKPGPGGKQYKYIPGDDVINRLNNAFEYEWSCEVRSYFKDENQVIALVSLKAGNVVHEGFGGAEIATYASGPKQGKVIDLSNAYKSAVTNAIKKAAEQFGIGLTNDEALDIVDVSNDYHNTPVAAPISPPVVNNTTPVASITSIKTVPVASPVAPAAAPVSSGPTAVSSMNLDELARAVKSAVSGTPFVAPEKKPVNDNVVQFPKSGGDNDKATDVQVQAIIGLSRMRKVSEIEVITKAIPGTSKTSFKELSMGEARSVIAFLQANKA